MEYNSFSPLSSYQCGTVMLYITSQLRIRFFSMLGYSNDLKNKLTFLSLTFVSHVLFFAMPQEREEEKDFIMLHYKFDSIT